MKGTFLEVLNGVQEGEWFRPIGWKGCGHAYCLDIVGGISYVPTPNGGIPAYMPDKELLIQKWESIPPDDVLQGL